MGYSRIFVKLRIKMGSQIIRLTGWIRSGSIKKNRAKGELYKAKVLESHFARKYIPRITNLSQRQVCTETPETIWQFWENPAGRSTPQIVKTSLESVKKFKGDFHHKILDNSTMGNYSDLPGYIIDKFNKKQIGYAHFSDLLRLNLLKNHGGIWLDATAYMTNFIPQYITDEDFFVFLTGEKTHFPYAFMQNCFIRSKKNNALCEAWYQVCVEFWKNETKTFDYFQHQLMFKTLILNHPAAKNLFNKMPHKSEDETHQLVGDNLLRKFDTDEWERIKRTSFFQKTTFKITGTAEHQDTFFSKLCEGKF
jgi:hypothetical protein